MEEYSLEVSRRAGRMLISINLGQRSIGSLILEKEDEEFEKQLADLLKEWNEFRRLRI